MVSEMSSTTQRGAAAAAVEARRTRAMLRREVRSSILCAAVQPCVSRECSDCWTAATTHVCNATSCLTVARAADVTIAAQSLSLLTQNNNESNAIACKILESKQAMHISIIHKMNPRTSSRGVQKTRRFSLKSGARLPPAPSAAQTIAAMEYLSALLCFRQAPPPRTGSSRQSSRQSTPRQPSEEPPRRGWPADDAPPSPRRIAPRFRTFASSRKL